MNPSVRFAKAEADFGKRFGQVCTIGRVGTNNPALDPDYSVFDQDPYGIGCGKYYIETTSNRFAQTKASNVEWYAIKGNRNPLKVGDILQPDRTGCMLSTTPDVTFVYTFPQGSCFGFKSTRVGAIYNGSTALFTNIRFEYLPTSSFPGAPLNRELEASLGVPSIQAVTFNKPLWTSTRDAEGLLLYQTDTTPNLIWEIVQVNTFDNILILDMKRSMIP